MTEFSIGNKKIGENNNCFIIAEIGINYNRKLSIAKKLIDSAINANCDSIKFQLFSAKRLYPKNAGDIHWKSNEKEYSYNIFKEVEKNELQTEWIPELIDYCKTNDIIFLSSISDETSSDIMEKFGIYAFKIPSCSLTNIPLIRHIVKKNKPIILSTGAGRINEIKKSYDMIINSNISLALLHCILQYPTSLKNVNMNFLDTLRLKFPKSIIGYSDHTSDPIKAPVVAVAKGAKIIEKHITLDRKMDGPDHFFSLEPDELIKMVKSIRDTEKILGSSIKKMNKNEKYLRKFTYQCIFTSRDIKKGEKFTSKNIIILRPGKNKQGLNPKFYDELINKNYITNRHLSANKPIFWEDIIEQ